MGFKDFKLLGQKEYRIYLVLVIYLLFGFVAMHVSILFGMPIIGIIIYYPFLAYTLLLYLFALFKKDIKKYSRKKLKISRDINSLVAFNDSFIVGVSGFIFSRYILICRIDFDFFALRLL